MIPMSVLPILSMNQSSTLYCHHLTHADAGKGFGTHAWNIHPADVTFLRQVIYSPIIFYLTHHNVELLRLATTLCHRPEYCQNIYSYPLPSNIPKCPIPTLYKSCDGLDLKPRFGVSDCCCSPMHSCQCSLGFERQW